MARNLKNTPFSIERLFVWALGICLLTSVIAMGLLAWAEKPIPPQIQSIAMIITGVFATQVQRLK